MDGSQPIDVLFDDIDPIEIELNEHWVQLSHAARHLARQRLGVATDELAAADHGAADSATHDRTPPARVDAEPTDEERDLALVIWRDWFAAGRPGDPPLEPARRELTDDERRWAEEWRIA